MTMRNIKSDIGFLLNPIMNILDEFCKSIKFYIDGLLVINGSYGTENCDLFAYASILKHKNGDEIAIGVSVENKDGCITIESDVSESSGRIILDGPSLNEKFIDWPSSHERCEVWLKEFEKFLLANFDIIINEIRKLPDENQE
ncbi:hypothetical protein [Serratia liquefaciens]|jgi:hypothetical protein|uniref:hypothetical protein n=1 Tax=Serratia liquefaciens TaxID=614 RepID=UPI002FF32E55